MALAIATSLYILRGSDLDEAQADTLVLGLNDLIAASPQWKKLKAADKQQLSDSRMLATTMMISLAQVGQSDDTSKQASEAMAREMLLRLTGSDTGG